MLFFLIHRLVDAVIFKMMNCISTQLFFPPWVLLVHFILGLSHTITVRFVMRVVENHLTRFVH